MKCFFSSALAFTALFTNAQTCLKYKQGQRSTMTAYRYANDQVFYPAWAKMKDSKKDENVAAFNAKVASGEMKGTPGTYVYDVKNVSVANGNERALVATIIAGKEYQSLLACINDTMRFTRLVGVNYSIDTNGDTIGFGILGIQSIPNKLKVGDHLAPYEDIGMTFPKTTTKIEKQKVLVGVENSTRTYRDLGWDPNAGHFPVVGTTTVKETKNIYETIDVKVRETLSFSSNTINYATAEVTGEEEVSIDGTKYKAFIIESQSWTKGAINKSYESNNDEWNKAKQAEDAKIKASMEKRGVKKGYTNAQGYVVTYRTEWFVPGIGMAKMDIYDNYGFILSHSVLESIK